MADLTFNTTAGQVIERELLIVYLNTGTTATPVWSPLGKRVEDSSSGYEWDSSTIRDILGSTYGQLRKPILSQSFEPGDLDGGDAAQVHLWNLAVKDQDIAKLAAQDVLVVHFYAGETATPFAERYPSSLVEVSGLGGPGGGNIQMPINITFGGERETGTATRNAETGVVTFTKVA